MKGCIISTAGVDSSRAAVTRSLWARAAIFKRCSMVLRPPQRNKQACEELLDPDLIGGQDQFSVHMNHKFFFPHNHLYLQVMETWTV